jgi:Uma2 family endonuclease
MPHRIQHSKGLLTIKAYARLPESVASHRSELVRGVVHDRPPYDFPRGSTRLAIGSILLKYCDQTKKWNCTLGSGVITERAPDTVRGPDVSLYCARRLPMYKVVKTYPDIPADLCVEVRSPDNTMKQLMEKAEEYLTSGVKAVWIADPKAKSVRVVTVNGTTILKNGDTLDGGDLLPGFSCKVADFFK